MWQMEDSEDMGRLKATVVLCLAVSMDGKWIAVGTFLGDVLVWDANTYKQIFAHRGEGIHDINRVEFSPDWTRLVSASDNNTAIVWDIATAKEVQTLCHEDSVRAVKYSPQGDWIATATRDCMRVYDSNDGHLLIDINATVT